MKRIVFLAALVLVSISSTRGQCKDVEILVAASFDTLIQCQSNANFLLPALPLRYSWEARTLEAVFIDSASSDRFLADLGKGTYDSISICLRVTDSTGRVCGLCDTMTFRDQIQHWRPINTNRGTILSVRALRVDYYKQPDRLYDILGREFDSIEEIPARTIFWDGRTKKIIIPK
jgi:hypothetical protein